MPRRAALRRAPPWGLLALTLALVAAVPPRAKQNNYRVILRGLMLEDCGKPNTYTKLNKAVFHIMPDGSDVVDVNFTIAKNVPYAREARVMIHRCREFISENTCEYFSTWSFTTALCSLMAMPNMYWTPMIKCITPPMRCPVKKGSYMSRNSTLDTEHPMMHSVIGGYVWKAVFSIFDQEHEEAMCVRLAVQAIKIRRPKAPRQ